MAAGTSSAARAQAAIAVESFDCFKVEGDGAPGGVPSGPGIGSWNEGGPAGANWNATDLVCAATMRTPCQDGDILSELRVGNVLVAQEHGPIRDGRVQWRASLREKVWKKHLDTVASSKHEPYRTAVFRLTALLTCRAPYESKPGIGPRKEFAADRMFVAGFAEGE